MRIVYKMIIFIISTILAILLDVYIVSRIFEIKDIYVAILVGNLLICIYMVFFLYINEKTMWMKC